MATGLPETLEKLLKELHDSKGWQNYETKDLQRLYEAAKATAQAPGVDRTFKRKVDALFDGMALRSVRTPTRRDSGATALVGACELAARDDSGDLGSGACSLLLAPRTHHR